MPLEAYNKRSKLKTKDFNSSIPFCSHTVGVRMRPTVQRLALNIEYL
jgi:hypothetical protein